jgi:anti-sigma regulatory factor (Ser/Thr protein kinase)
MAEIRTRQSYRPWELHTVQSRDLKMAPALRSTVRSLATALTGDKDILDRLETAVGEALANAIGHGRGPTFSVAVYGNRDEISVTVMNRDGHHTHWDFCKPMPTFSSDRGRGLPIMRKMMDQVDVTWQGTQVSVWMTIKLTKPR